MEDFWPGFTSRRLFIGVKLNQLVSYIVPPARLKVVNVSGRGETTMLVV
jgi:hypothetical protein